MNRKWVSLQNNACGGVVRVMRRGFVWRMLAILAMWVCLSPWGMPSALAVEPAQQLTRMEQQLFSRVYQAESPESRLSRVEAAIFGAPQSNQPVATRLKALEQFFQAPQQAVTPLAQGPPSFQPNPPVHPPAAPTYSALPAEEAHYPAVAAMEQQLFHQTFDQEPIDNRLSRLETRAIGQVQRGTLQERTDQLRMIVMGDAGNSAMTPSAPQALAAAGLPNAGNAADNTSDLLMALPRVEKKILRQTFPQDSIEGRLNRLETKVFSSTAPEMSPEDRLYRIVSVANARGGPSRMDQARRPSTLGPGSNGSYSASTGGQGAGGVIGSMLLMILMSLL